METPVPYVVTVLLTNGKARVYIVMATDEEDAKNHLIHELRDEVDGFDIMSVVQYTNRFLRLA